MLKIKSSRPGTAGMVAWKLITCFPTLMAYAVLPPQPTMFQSLICKTETLAKMYPELCQHSKYRNAISIDTDSPDKQLREVASWLTISCQSDGPVGLDNVFSGEFEKAPGVFVRGIGFAKDMNEREFFMCLPKRCWFGPATMPRRYSLLAEKHPEQCGTIQYVAAFWFADEVRRLSVSRWKHYLNTIPTVEDYAHYHPGMARLAGDIALGECLERVKSGKIGDTFTDEQIKRIDAREKKEEDSEKEDSENQKEDAMNSSVPKNDCRNKLGSDVYSAEELKELTKEEAVRRGFCKRSWKPKGDAVSYWDAWYQWLRQAHEKYVEEFWKSKKIEEQIEVYCKPSDDEKKKICGGDRRKLLKKFWDTGKNPIDKQDKEAYFTVPSGEKGRDLITSSPLSYDTFLNYAYLVVMTRDYADVGNLPLLDLPNTAEDYNSHQYWYDRSQDVFCLMTERAVKAGEEVNVNYSHDSKDGYIMFAQYAFAFGKEHQAKASRMLCRGLEPDSEVHDGQNGVADNFSRFAERYCNEEDLKAERKSRLEELYKSIDIRKKMAEIEEDGEEL